MRVKVPRLIRLPGAIVAGLGMVLLLSIAAPTISPGYAATETGIENLGVPLREVNIRSAAIGQWVDERPVVYTYSNGAKGVFSVLDAQSGERLAAHTVSDSTSFAMSVAADNSVYISTHGDGLYRYIPERDEVVHLGRPGGEAYILGTDSDENGVVYGGTFPNGHVFRYDPAADEFRDYGQVAEGESYVRSVAYDGDGTLYAGTRPNGRLFAIDVQSGTKREIALPESAADANNLLYMTFQRGLLLVQTVPGLDWHVYDAKAGAWIDHIVTGSEGSMTDVIGAKTYFVNRATRNLIAYDVRTRELSPTSWDEGQLSYQDTRAIGYGVLAGADSREFPGRSVIGVGLTGRIWHFNPKTGAHRFVDGEPLGSPVAIHALASGPDGNMYIGGYFTTGTMGRYLADTGEFEQFPGPTQVSGFGSYRGKLYLSTYPGGGMMAFDPSAAWDFGTNPKAVFDLGEGQDRGYAVEPAGDRLAVGTIADSRRGYLDGQLMFYDPATGDIDRKGTVTPGHGVASLASDGSILIGGTSMHHLAAEPPDPSAELFIWDLTSDEIVWRGSPAPDAEGIGALTFDADGDVWALTSQGVVFEFDPGTRTVLRRVEVADSAAIWGIPSLFFGPDGKLYGSTGGTFDPGVVFSLDVDTLDVTHIDSGAFAASDDQGRIYYTRGAELLRFTP